MTIDPVCGMEVTEADAVTASHGGRRYRFCSTACRDLFQRSPGTFLGTPHPHLSTSGGLTVPRLPYGRAGGEFDLSIADPERLSVGDRVTFTKALSEADVRKFAEATGDTNALHLDDRFAGETRFGRRIVHGTLVSGLVSAALACLPGVTIYLSQELRFRRPVDIGETVRVVCEVTADEGESQYELETRVETAAGEVSLDGTATVLVDELPEL